MDYMGQIDWTPLMATLQGVTFSEGEVARMLKVGRPKVQRMIANSDIMAVQKSGGNGRVACDAWSVLGPIIGQCVKLAQINASK